MKCIKSADRNNEDLHKSEVTNGLLLGILGIPRTGPFGLRKMTGGANIYPQRSPGTVMEESSGSLDCWVFRPGKGLLHECEENQLFPIKQWINVGSQ